MCYGKIAVIAGWGGLPYRSQHGRGAGEIPCRSHPGDRHTEQLVEKLRVGCLSGDAAKTREEFP